MSEKNQKNFQNENKNSSALFRDIERACAGLIYISETDAPMLAFRGTETDHLSGETIIRQVGGKAEDAIEEISFDDFFARLTTVKEWFGETERARATKFLELQKLLEEHLSQRKVFRIGKIRLDIYAVGIDKDGCLMGVKTMAVET